MNKWHFFLGIFFLLLNSCVANNDLSCGQVLANYINANNTVSGNFEALLRKLLPNNLAVVAGKSCGSSSNFVYYLMHKQNISDIKNSSQLRKDILDFAISGSENYQSKEELSQLLNNQFLQNKEDDARRTAVCSFNQTFERKKNIYSFLGNDHDFIIEKGGKDEFRLWQSWIYSFSVFEWVQGYVESETEPRDTTYTHGKLPLRREEAEHLISDLVMYSDSNLDWNQRQKLSSKLFWLPKNLFMFDGTSNYFTSNGTLSYKSSCEKAYSNALTKLFEDMEIYLNVTSNLKYVEETRNASIGSCRNLDNDIWLVRCNENIFSSIFTQVFHSYLKCHSDISKHIDLSNAPNLPKVNISMNCQITTKPNNGNQCMKVLKHIYKILEEES